MSTGEWVRKKSILCGLFGVQTYEEELVERSLKHPVLAGQLAFSDGSHAAEGAEF